MHPGSLLTLLENEQRTRDEARVALGDVRFMADQARAQAEQLQQYRSEYAQRWSTQFRQQGGIELVQCYQGFMQRLEQAITQQQAAVLQAQAREQAAQAHLADCELRLASVEKLLQRRLAEQERVARRHEQRATDEAASRARQHGSAQGKVDGLRLDMRPVC
jgi:flagellar FliJ protein